MIRRLLIASLLGARVMNAQGTPDIGSSRGDSVLVAAVMYVLSTVPAGTVGVDPEYRVVAGEPGHATVVSYAHSRGFLAAVSGDRGHKVVFQSLSETLPDSARCGIAQRMATSAAARANGECLLRGVPAHVSIARYKIADTLATVSVSILENNAKGGSYARVVELTVERRGARWIVTRQRTMVES